MRNALIPVVVVVLLVVGGSLTGASQEGSGGEGTVLGSPDLAAAAADNRLEPGETRALTVTLANAGSLVRGGPERFEDRVTTARNVRVDVATERLSPALQEALSVESGTVLVGAVDARETQQVNVTLGVQRSLPPGEYVLPLRVSYAYTSLVRWGSSEPEYNDADRDQVLEVTFVVEDRPQLSVSTVETDALAPGERGNFSFTVTNDGTAVARDVGLVLEADGVNVGFGGGGVQGTRAGVFVDELEPGESREFTLAVSARQGIAPGTYLVSMTADYEGPDGFQLRQSALRAGVAVRATNATATATSGGSNGSTSRRSERVSRSREPTERAIVEPAAVPAGLLRPSLGKSQSGRSYPFA